jgi:D-arabinose 1-dehydrogenase-like Zn-dependent alcohol dehydrogenase
MTGPGAIEVREFPYPTPEPGALVLRMVLAGICGTDKHTFKGENVQYAGTKAQSTTPFPIIPGHENLGVVAELGPDGGQPRWLGQQADSRFAVHTCRLTELVEDPLLHSFAGSPVTVPQSGRVLVHG